MPCRAAKFTSEDLLKFYLFDKIRIQSSTGAEFKHFINGKNESLRYFISDFNPSPQRAKNLSAKAYHGSNLTQNSLASQPVKKINEDKNK